MIDNFMTGDTSRPDWMVKLMVGRQWTTWLTSRPAALQNLVRMLLLPVWSS